MCGITGFISENNVQSRRELIRRMTDIITHRGPDEAGFHIDDSIALGMRRLSIIDLKEGSQPVYNEDRTCVIVFNGEIYNFRDLRKDLSGKGHTFRSEGDTETIIHAYEEYGLDCVHRLNGMFAFAIWDEKRRRLVLARDRLGVKPLHYYYDDRSFVFGSEIKSLLQFPGIPKRIDFEALNLFLSFYYIPGPYTIYQGVKCLPPGHYLVFEEGKDPHPECYWDVKIDSSIQRLGLEEHSANIRSILADSVKLRMISEVPLGAFLSGGIDSSIVVGLMSQSSSTPVKTFNICFKGYSVYDESERARAVASFNRTEHHEFNVACEDLVEIIPHIIWDLEQPFADSSAIPTYYVSRETRKYVTVALTGDGGDELFGGYAKYSVDYWYNLYHRLPALLRTHGIEGIIHALPAGRGTRFKEYVRKAKKFLQGNVQDPSIRHHNLMECFSSDMRRSLFKNSDNLADTISHRLVESYFSRFADQDNLFRMSYTDLKLALPDDMLTKVDRMSMLNSLEARSPFLDYRLVEYAFSLPSEYKLKGRTGKYVLKHAFRDLLPAAVIHKGKSGFGIPLGEWFRKGLKSYVSDILSADRIREQGIFNPGYVEEVLRTHWREEEDFSNQLWSLLVFGIWYDLYMKN